MTDLHISFKVGDTTYVLPTRSIVQMESFEGATRVPGTPSYVIGLVQVRGAVVPVLDLRARFGLPPIDRTLDSRIVVVERSGRRVALLVDSARDILKIAASDFESPPDVVTKQASGFVSAIARVAEKLVMLVDCDRLIAEEDTHGHHDSQRN
ncbi:MAG TPA: chemotaxis protein CheW [Polyangiaceae bacterium]|nr:chemotaxis protein CheW [Polyangiaceae bacterium]